MIPATWDLAIVVFALACMWFIWDMGIKPLLLDAFRERLFRLRFKLFQLGMSGELSFDSEAYRSIELLLCGLLRFAHRVTFAGFLLTIFRVAQAKRAKQYVDYHAQIELKVSRTSPEARGKLNAILNDISDAMIAFMSLGSSIFMSLFGIYLATKGFRAIRSVVDKRVTATMQSEFYSEFQREQLNGAFSA